MSPCGKVPTYSLGSACPGLTRAKQTPIHESLHRLEALGCRYGLDFHGFDVLIFPKVSGLTGIPRPFYNLTLLPENALQTSEGLLDCLLLHEYFHCLISWQAFHHPPSESPEFYGMVRDFLEDWKAWDRSVEFSLSHREDIKDCIGSIIKDKPWVAWGIRGIETRGVASHYVNRYFRVAREKLQEAELAYFVEGLSTSTRTFTGYRPYDLQEGLCTLLATSLMEIPIKDFYHHFPHTEAQESAAHSLQSRYGPTMHGLEGLLKRVKEGTLM